MAAYMRQPYRDTCRTVCCVQRSGLSLIMTDFESGGDERHEPLVDGSGTLENFETGAGVHPFPGRQAIGDRAWPWELIEKLPVAIPGEEIRHAVL
jgi:hypothetical protein